MAISIEDFRKSLNVGLSRDLVQKILTKYENFDFSSVNTNNGTKLREIDAYNPENVSELEPEELSYFLNIKLKTDYLVSRGAYLKAYSADKETQREIVSKASKVLKNSLYSRPNTLTISSKVILDNPQKDEASHILTINTDTSSIVSIVNSLYTSLSNLGIPFDIEIPKYSTMNNGTTEAIKLHVTTMDLENTIKAIAKLDKVYKDEIKKPNMFNANVKDLFGYDSVIDINGTRSSDLLGVAIIKALDKTLVDLAKDESFENVSTAEYLRNAENKDEARKKVIQRVKTNYPNIIDPVLLETVKVIKEESLAINPDNIFVSDMADSELNVEFGTFEEEIINVNEIEEIKEEEKTTEVIKEAAKEATASITTSLKAGVQSIHDLLSNQYIQPAITFGATSFDKIEDEAAKLEPSESLKVENPTVTVIEPIQKENELNELPQPTFDTIDENVQPVLTSNELVEKNVADFVLPGEEEFIEPVQTTSTGMETKSKEVIVPEAKVQDVVEPKDVIPLVVPSVEKEPVEIESQVVETPVDIAFPTTKVETPVLPVEETVNEITQVEEPVKIDEVQSEEIPEVPTFNATEEVVVPPVVEEAVGIPVEDSSEVEVQKANETQVITEPILPVEEPIIKDDTKNKIDETQILPVVEQTQVPTPEIPSGIKEVITPEVNPVPTYNPQDYLNNPEVKEEQTLQNEIEQKLTQLENAPVDTRTIEIPTEEIKEESDILSAISNNLEVTDSSKLSTEEKIAVVADTFTKPVDPVRQAKIDKYAGIFIDNQVLDFHVRDANNEEIIKEDGTPYTFLDYLEDNKVLEKIQLDSKYYIKDDPSRDFVDGKTFIREYVIRNSVNGNRSIEDIIDWYVKSITNINEQPKKKGFFSFGRK